MSPAYRLVLLATLPFMAVACGDTPPQGEPTPPMADFSADMTTGEAPLTVQFLDESDPGSEPITAWSWTLGDGTTSDDPNPSHTYTAMGSYAVSLTVTTAAGSDTREAPGFIVVTEPGTEPTPTGEPTPTLPGSPTPTAIPTPTPTATALPDAPEADFRANDVIGVAPLTLTFEDLSDDGGGEISDWAWDFGDGGTSADEEPEHTYDTPGTYAVSLTITTGAGSDSLTKAGYITVADPAFAPDIPEDSILINEILANPGSGQSPFVELWNGTEAPVDVSGWYLGTEDTNPLSAEIPPNSIVPAGGYLSVMPEGLVLDPLGGYLALASATEGTATGYFQDEGYDPQPEGRSAGWHETSHGEQDFVPLREASEGEANALPYIGPVYVSEIYYNPEADGPYEFFELYNQGSEAIDLGAMGYTVGDALDFEFPQGAIIDPGGYVVVAEDPEALREAFDIPDSLDILGPFDDGRLANGGERFLLNRIEEVGSGAGEVLQDRIDYDDKDPWPESPDGDGASLSRLGGDLYGSDPASWEAAAPSPGAGEPATPSGTLLITELMYHHPSHLPEADWIEVMNPGDAPINLAGFQFTDGFLFTFPDEELAAGAYAVVAKDPTTFQQNYPGVTNVYGPFEGGQLAEKGELVILESPLGIAIQSLRYADEGAWSTRVRGPEDYGHEGWVWDSPHDGLGYTLERRSLTLSEGDGLNWGPSDVEGGTPGAINSLQSDDIAPIIKDITHAPLIPGPGDTVVVTAAIEDEGEAAPTVSLLYRGSPGNFVEAEMFDDGAHGDGAAGDGIFGGELPGQSEGAVVEFYIKAEDLGGNIREWPIYRDGSEEAAALYQVMAGMDLESPDIPEGQGLYVLVMTSAEEAELEDIGNGEDEEGIEDEHESNAQMNTTAILWRDGEWRVRYHSGLRNRGNSSRSRPPNNYRLNYPHDRPYRGKTAINLNAKYPHAQVAGFRIFALGGIAAPTADPAQVRINGANLADGDSNMHGSYAAVEALNGEFVDAHFPSKGNLYRGWERADFTYGGESQSIYSTWYRKQTNEELGDWGDIVDLTGALNPESDAGYSALLQQELNMAQWARWMAIDNLLGNVEHGLVTGEGDDYALFIPFDELALLVPHDQDSVLGDNQYYPDWTYEGYANVAGLKRLMNHPDYRQLYHDNIRYVANTLYTPEVISDHLDQWLGTWVAPETIEGMKDFVIERRQKMLEQARAETLVPEGATWRFFDGGRAPTGDWTSPGYNDDSWGEGAGPFGWGEEDLTTAIDAGGVPTARPMAVYFRLDFEVEDASLYSGIISRVWRDDGAIVYLNGQEIVRRDMPEGEVTYDTPASKELRGQSEPWFREDRINDPSLLVDGQNTLAVEIHQRTVTSEDMRFDYILRAIPSTPHDGEFPDAWAAFPWESESLPYLPVSEE